MMGQNSFRMGETWRGRLANLLGLAGVLAEALALFAVPQDMTVVASSAVTTRIVYDLYSYDQEDIIKQNGKRCVYEAQNSHAVAITLACSLLVVSTISFLFPRYSVEKPGLSGEHG